VPILDRPLVNILDKQRYWAFVKAYVICYVSLVGLYVIIDAFANVDEFYKRAEGVELFRIMGRYYLVHQSQFFDQLCGVIGMMAAIFTVTWMQRNNEQLAMLAAGISTHRAILPVLVSSIIVNALAACNQEYIIPRFGEELARRHDDDGQQKINYVTQRYDARGIMIHGKLADRASKTILRFYATLGRQNVGAIRSIEGQQATYIPPDHPTAPLTGGWLVRDATINPPLDDEALRARADLLTRVTDLTGFPPPLDTRSRSDRLDDSAPPPAENVLPSLLTPHSEVAYLAALPPMPMSLSWEMWRTHVLLDRKLDFGRGTYFLKSSLTFQAMTRRPGWYQFATTPEVLSSLLDPAMEGSEGTEVAIFLHIRLMRPFLSMSLLFMSLPLVLGGYGRNMFINLGFALGNSALFYATLIFTQYLASFDVIQPPLAAWAPLIGFGTIATLRWGRIRT
jgi:lipopolysaccharide export system permease protein